MTGAPSFTFRRSGRRLVDSTGAFAISEKSGPDYYTGAALGYIDGRPLFEFTLNFEHDEEGAKIIISRGRRDHRFDEYLIGKLFPLLRDALPAIIDLPVCSERGGDRLFIPSDLAEHVAYRRWGSPTGELIEIARRIGD